LLEPLFGRDSAVMRDRVATMRAGVGQVLGRACVMLLGMCVCVHSQRQTVLASSASDKTQAAVAPSATVTYGLANEAEQATAAAAALTGALVNEGLSPGARAAERAYQLYQIASDTDGPL
jgi:hypothetical protein